MNVQISGVTSAPSAFQDNCSDDDVIEVVRDEAPIEILSDGEELEIERKNSQPSVIQNFHFTSVPAVDTSYGDKDEGKVPEDPLNNTEITVNVQNSIEIPITGVPCPVIALPPPPIENVDNKVEDPEKEPELNDENVFVNVTDETICNAEPNEQNTIEPDVVSNDGKKNSDKEKTSVENSTENKANNLIVNQE